MRVYSMSGPPDFRRQAHSYLGNGQYSLSLNLAKERLIANPDDIPATVIACRSCLGMGDIDEARNFLTRLDAVNGELSQLFKNFGDVYRQQGDEGQARIFYRKSAALSPDGGDDAAAPNHGDDDPEEDEGMQERPLDLSTDFQTLTMADLYIRQGHHEGAREILEAILAREPNHEEARQQLDELRALLNEKISDLPIDKKTTVVHELSQWLNRLGRDHHDSG
jgi:tetratricopeptide (TPR) repeat protein